MEDILDKNKQNSKMDCEKRHKSCYCGHKSCFSIPCSDCKESLCSRFINDMGGRTWCIGCDMFLYFHKRHFRLGKDCYHCGKPLTPIGNARTNGADHEDWDTRQFHKKCWRQLKIEQE